MSARPLTLSICALCAGCGGDARLELAASDALDALAGQMATALAEYHLHIEAADDTREQGATAAFVQRVVKDHSNDAGVSQHVEVFHAAMDRIRADRRVEWRRRAAVLDNAALMREMADGLRESAWQGMTLNDELRRYLRRWSEVTPASEGVLDERLAE